VTAAPWIQAEPYRRELLGYCYRFFGSYAEAEDAVQETVLRAWQRGASFRGAASVRTWLYRIATNVCLDMRKAPQRRALPMDLGGPGQTGAEPGWVPPAPDSDQAWVSPLPDAALEWSADPATLAAQRESVHLAFVTALQVLPARQRAVVLLRDVVEYSAAECSEILGVSVAAVNSALARGRAALAERAAGPGRDGGTGEPTVGAEADRTLVASYVAAFEAYDVDRLVALLAEDATFTMPPYRFWLRGPADIERWWRGPGQVCRDSRTIVTAANGRPAVAVYHPVSPGRWEPFAIHVLDRTGPRLAGITHFLGPAAFAEFGLPDSVRASRSAPTDQFAPSASSTPVNGPSQ
jgi:RNA polymerase sigma-70 factor (ECF subfamily)